MSTPTLSRTELIAVVNGICHGKFGQVQDQGVVINRAVKKVISEIDIRSTKRSAPLSPNLFTEIYEYTAPTDLKGEKVIDFRKQVNRPSSERFTLVDDADFDRIKGSSRYNVALRDENFGKLLRIDGISGDKTKLIHNCESLTSNGTWAATADASNLTLDNDNYISGGGSLNFDMAAGGTTGYIENSTMTQVDLSDYEDKGSVFIWVFIPDYSDAEGDTVTNFILRIGNDTSNYVSRTITVNNEGATFKDGWNLLRFDLNGATASAGTVAWATIDYIRLTVTKSASLAADTDWRVDSISAKIGDIYDTVYYSKYGWQTSALAYIEESTTGSDLLVADTDEMELYAFKAAEYAAQELKDYDDMKMQRADYNDARMRYEANNPSEALKKLRRYGALPNFRNM